MYLRFMIKVSILGSGNIGSHLIDVFTNTPSIELVQIYNRTIEKIKSYESRYAITDSIENLRDADIYIIAVSDDAINSFSKSLKLKNKLIVHTSGTKELTILEHERIGVFYPLQTFTKNVTLDFLTVPICIEANNDKDEKLLKALAHKISNNVSVINSLQRKKLHLAAVFVNNFVNHLYHIGNDICTENQVSFDLLKPLIKETAAKISSVLPYNAQTGPAKRNNEKTINTQLAQLNNSQKEIYSIFSKSIQQTYQ